jgi:hypothetical protein
LCRVMLARSALPRGDDLPDDLLWSPVVTCALRFPLAHSAPWLHVYEGRSVGSQEETKEKVEGGGS